MKTSLGKRVAAGLAALLTLASAMPSGFAQADDRDAAIAAGAVGGLTLNALLGSALAAPPAGSYGPPPPPWVYTHPSRSECGYREIRVYDERGRFAGLERVPAC